MYTLNQLWEDYHLYSSITSTIARQLAFGAAAICWLFKNSDNNSFPFSIYLCLFFIVLFFFSDGLQYYFGAIIRKNIIEAQEKGLENELPKKNRLIEKDKTQEGESMYEYPDAIDYHSYFFWRLKLYLLVIAFMLIIFQFLISSNFFGFLCTLFR